jgi:SSS family solute:Na+ symporter
MTILDWIIVLIPLTLLACIIGYAQRYNKSVVDFMSAGRCAGRYLLATSLVQAWGAVAGGVVGFEVFCQAGFTWSWWGAIAYPVALLASVTGFVIYRYRETRALTLAQFFEIRYTRRFRLFMGGLGFAAGALNYGVFPAIEAKFMVYFLGLPDTIQVLSVAFPTWIMVAVAYLSCALTFVLSGGQISLVISDFCAGLMTQIFCVIIAITLLCTFSWHHIVTVLEQAPKGQSMLNPFDTSAAKDFNVWFIVIQMLTSLYGTMAWQNSSGFNSSALSPHESRMAFILGNWKGLGLGISTTMLALGAFTFLKDPFFAAQATQAGKVLHDIHSPEVQNQMQYPVALSYILPMGIKGIYCAGLMMSLISGDSVHLHSWGSIFTQDVVLPLLKKPLSPQQHIRLLRWSITGVAVFALCFSILFVQSQPILMWWMITMTFFVSGAGAAIIGGLYWKKGTVQGAWCAVITGSTMAMTAIYIKQTHPGFPLNSQYMSLIVTLSAISVYVLASLLTHREDFNMDRMLHRGIYALSGEHLVPVVPLWQRFRLSKLVGIDEEFTRGDKAIAYSIFTWSMFWFSVVVIGSIWNWWSPWPIQWWTHYWFFVVIIIPMIIAVVTTIWFTIGGLRDLRIFFRKLKTERRDIHDDGTVIGHQNWNELDPVKPSVSE